MRQREMDKNKKNFQQISRIKHYSLQNEVIVNILKIINLKIEHLKIKEDFYQDIESS